MRMVPTQHTHSYILAKYGLNWVLFCHVNTKCVIYLQNEYMNLNIFFVFCSCLIHFSHLFGIIKFLLSIHFWYQKWWMQRICVTFGVVETYMQNIIEFRLNCVFSWHLLLYLMICHKVTIFADFTCMSYHF